VEPFGQPVHIIRGANHKDTRANPTKKYFLPAESGLHLERFGFRSFRVCVLAKSAARLNNLRQISTLSKALFLFGQIGSVNAGNFFNAVWRTVHNTAINLVEA
jgi:hypothetical protein